MYIKSTNIAKPKRIIYNDKLINTGIYKTPTTNPIFLGVTNVKHDYIGDKKVHGGSFKACYLFSTNHYSYWKTMYPNLNWSWGMFGENLSISGLNETKIMVGNIYKVGNAIVQITQPREPCYKFGVKFHSQNIIKQFINYGFPGTYVRILQEGYVKNGDTFKLIDTLNNSLSIAALFHLIFAKIKRQDHLKIAVDLEVIPEQKRKKLRQFII